MTQGVTDSFGRLPAESGDPVANPKIFGGEGKCFHERGGRARRMMRQVFALKREWTRMEGMML